MRCGILQEVEAFCGLPHKQGGSAVWEWGHLLRNYPSSCSPGCGVWPCSLDYQFPADSLDPSDSFWSSSDTIQVPKGHTPSSQSSSKSKLLEPFLLRHPNSHCMPNHQVPIICSFHALWKVACYLHSSSRPVSRMAKPAITSVIQSQTTFSWRTWSLILPEVLSLHLRKYLYIL